ncbi:tRNA (adenosine(37)-N6)-threonylcarbamoyltransferase complex dimerization subunit type 1 TsaB [Mechercharimyces sp. CAU 1602]|uniref:tRNA (adenosine(37)-N6)-threonylcarbamoyltransferase complex dimerization subunit type 1 TsaB n=1 Tax=Mechercharimyces sp. CAU 1602 TaxID=2973933 RepID=UPI002161B377|nr:tRNA (adenosine(37)-N6)-threonylcarbamoyltransferase complex dimerization subunit type 1 TsaB [Mechercharimyces sp. CAU 1602]MCS1352125.1 tRNA (adenosine(37)-N6)-threonylcarbamoyltransferase complex dimerization subunit type 1 TsaB [Mechercharimyces sp. CAU 1602]
MKMLALDTSTLVLGVAVVEEGHVLGEVTTNLKKNHSVRLMPTINHLLTDLGLSINDIDVIAVAQGPGSYTGVRIGVTTAKTMAWSLKLPLIGVSSLETLASNGNRFTGKIVPMFDARRRRIYTGLYQWTDGSGKKDAPEGVRPLDEWLLYLKDKGPLLFLGDDVASFRPMIIEAVGEDAFFGYADENIPRASRLAQIAWEKWKKGESVDAHSFVPEYLQLTEAETKWKEKQQGDHT